MNFSLTKGLLLLLLFWKFFSLVVAAVVVSVRGNGLVETVAGAEMSPNIKISSSELRLTADLPTVCLRARSPGAAAAAFLARPPPLV